MLSGQVNASQLLAAFLGNAKEKLGQVITNNDFSGELARHLPKPSGTSDPQKTVAVETDNSTSDSKVSSTGSAVSSEAKTSASVIVKDSGLTTSSEKLNGLKSKTRAEKSLFVSNPAVLETVLANLHYPAETRAKCQALLSKQGHLSLQDLRSILGARPGAGSGEATGVPAASVRVLVDSVVKAPSSAAGKAVGAAKSIKSSVAIKTDGSYTREELRDLLDKVVQASQKSSQKAQASTLSSTTSSTGATKTVEGLQNGQAQELVSTVLPSFIFSDRKPSVESVLTAKTGNKPSKLQEANANLAGLGENSVNVVSGGSNSLGHVKSDSSAGNGEMIGANPGAVMPGGQSGASGGLAGVVATGREEKIGAAASGSEVAGELADWTKARMTAEQGSGASVATAGGDSLKDVQSSAELGGQDTPMLGKQIERSVGGRDQSSENGVLQTAAANHEENLISLPQMDNSGGDGFVFYDRNQPAEPVQNTRGAKTGDTSTTNRNDNGIATILASYTSSDDQARSTAGILTGSGENREADSQSVKSAGQSGSDKSNPVSVSGEQTAQGAGSANIDSGNGPSGTLTSTSTSASASASASALASASARSVGQKDAVSAGFDFTDRSVESAVQTGSDNGAKAGIDGSQTAQISAAGNSVSGNGPATISTSASASASASARSVGQKDAVSAGFDFTDRSAKSAGLTGSDNGAKVGIDGSQTAKTSAAGNSVSGNGPA
ncbi:MAG: hypothetical protein P4L55_02945, partial [Syntrophobacteraceae bacterium]|nr:hypothetical protein [Syntrophobacteraceae bacterium]